MPIAPFKIFWSPLLIDKSHVSARKTLLKNKSTTWPPLPKRKKQRMSIKMDTNRPDNFYNFCYLFISHIVRYFCINIHPKTKLKQTHYCIVTNKLWQIIGLIVLLCNDLLLSSPVIDRLTLNEVHFPVLMAHLGYVFRIHCLALL